jgi:hypothetical protein
MKIEQIFTGCLAQVAYYIESNGKAVLIDSLREVDLYIQKAKAGSSRSSTYLKCILHMYV